jgi:NurA domain
MAINFQQVITRIREIGLGARERNEKLEQLRSDARNLLNQWSDQADRLAQILERAVQFDSSLRCAMPLSSPLIAAFDPQPSPPQLTLIAADGSQIAPDRHTALLYSLVNVGAIVLQTGSNQAPFIHTDSRLLADDEMYTESGMLTPEAIEQQRDLAERRKLVELAKDFPGMIIALTDGPLELWGARGGAEDEYRRNLELHKSTLSQMQEIGAVVAGYVDKPGADLVVRLLEISSLVSDEQFKQLRTHHPLRGVSDRWVFGQFLKPGQRSVVFGLQSSARLHYTGALALHFFYLNIGIEKHPYLVRVEIPKWVAEDAEKLDTLHSALLDQCRQMGAHPYPYILHRAHEIAVVKFDEKQQVEAMLQQEIIHSGGELEEASHKSSAKALPGKGKR